MAAMETAETAETETAEVTMAKAAAPSGQADPEALVASICKETGGRVSPCGFVTRIGSSAPLSGALRDATLAHVNMVRRMLASDICEYVAAGMPAHDVALLQRVVGHAENLRDSLAANVPYPSVSVVAELMMLTREVSEVSFNLNNILGIAEAADELPGLIAGAL